MRGPCDVHDAVRECKPRSLPLTKWTEGNITRSARATDARVTCIAGPGDRNRRRDVYRRNFVFSISQIDGI